MSIKLNSFQRAGVAFLVVNRRALLADPMGTGKTGQFIRTLQVLDYLGERPFPALIVCPNSLKVSTWRGELTKWAPRLRVQIIDGAAAQRRKQLNADADVYVINYESARTHTRIAGYGTIALTDKEKLRRELNAKGFRTVIADEYHKCKNPHAVQTRAVWALMHDAEFRYGGTGTPTADNIGDFWSLGHGLEPTWFPAKTKFLDRYAETSLNVFGGMEVHGLNKATKDEFYRIIDPLMRRIPKEAALPHLPPKLPPVIRHTPMTPKQKKAYDQMRDHMIALVEDNLLVAVDAIAQLIRLTQFASASAEMDEMGKVKLSAPSSKVDDLIDLLEEMGNEPLVVAAVSRQLIELAAARLDKEKISYGLVTGAQSVYERHQAVERFQAGRIRCILLTLGAGAEGLTLTRANRMLFMQESYSEIQNAQGQDRVHRIGSEIHQFVQIIKQVAPDTVEERRLELLAKKQMNMEEVVRDKQTLLKLLGAAA